MAVGCASAAIPGRPLLRILRCRVIQFLLSAVGIILVGSFPGGDRSGEPASTVSAEIPVDEPSTASEIEFDEEGRRIFNMGEVAVHFPEKFPSTSDGSSDGRVFNTCWAKKCKCG